MPMSTGTTGLREGRDRAVVLGAGVAGLLAARVLADSYGEVVVVERDRLSSREDPRRGVPQGRHVHALLARGLDVLEDLFPGLTRDLRERGAPTGDMLADTRVCFGGHRFRPGPSGLAALGVSRPALEGYLRERVRALPAVLFRDECDVTGLRTTPDGTRVVGARMAPRAEGSRAETLPTDLVVDATGRGSRLDVWLRELGYRAAGTERVDIGLGYASRTFRLRPQDLGGSVALLSGPTPEHPRGGALSAVEDGRCVLTLFGLLGDHPPTDPAGFADFAASLGMQDIIEAVADAEPLDDPVAFRFPTSVRHRYGALSRFPDGLLVMGDARCVFNPIYGQGMTVAAVQAQTLRRHLDRFPQPRPLRFLADSERVVGLAWELATGADLAVPGVRGRRSARSRVLGRYVGHVQAAAADDPVVGRAFLRVAGLVDPPQRLLGPAVAARVAGSSARRAGRARPGRRALQGGGPTRPAAAERRADAVETR